MIVRWGLDGLGPLLNELGIDRPLLVTSERFAALGEGGVCSHGPPVRRGSDDVLGLRVDTVLRHARRGTTHQDRGIRCEHRRDPVAKAAKAQKVSTAGAKTAYTRAPYKKPALKYL